MLPEPCPALRAAMATTGCVPLDLGFPISLTWAQTTLTLEFPLVSESQGREGPVLLEEAQGRQPPLSPRGQSFLEPEAQPHRGHRTQVRQASIPPSAQGCKPVLHNPAGGTASAFDVQSCTTPHVHTETGHTYTRQTQPHVGPHSQMQTHRGARVLPPRRGHHRTCKRPRHAHKTCPLNSFPNRDAHAQAHTHITHTSSRSAMRHTQTHTHAWMQQPLENHHPPCTEPPKD